MSIAIYIFTAVVVIALIAMMTNGVGVLQALGYVLAVLAIIAFVVLVGAVLLWIAMTSNGKNPFQ